MNDVAKIASYGTLVDVLEGSRGVDRTVTYVEGENTERRVSYGDVYTRALGILYHLQAMGAQRGDKMIIFLSNNEQFLDGFWAAVCGGITRCRWPSASATSIGTSCCAWRVSSVERCCTPTPRIWSGCRRSPRRWRIGPVRGAKVPQLPGGIDHRHLAAGKAASAGAG